MKLENPNLQLTPTDAQSGKITWRSPSNIALVKYWGKHGRQLPRNPNISFTLNDAATTMSLAYKVKAKFDNKINLDFTYYNILSENQILSAALPASSGC